MASVLFFVTRLDDKTGSLGTVVAAISSLGAAIGLGFLAQRECFLLTKVLPGATVLTLAVHIPGYFHHRQWYRPLLGVRADYHPANPLFLVRYLLEHRSNLYDLGLMIAVSIWGIFWPGNKHCKTNTHSKGKTGKVLSMPASQDGK